MVAVITALFFTCAAGFAVLTISRSFAGSIDRIDALFAQYRSLDNVRFATGAMRPVARYTPAPAPDYAPHNVVALSVRAGRTSVVSPAGWRVAA